MKLPMLRPEGNVPESARIGGEENNVPVMLSRLDETIGFFEKNLSNALGLQPEVPQAALLYCHSSAPFRQT